jgi:hypothetical protein
MLKKDSGVLKITTEGLNFFMMNSELSRKSESHVLNFEIDTLSSLDDGKMKDIIGKMDGVSCVNLIIEDFLLNSFIYCGLTLNEKNDVDGSVEEILKGFFSVEIEKFYYDYRLFREKELSFMVYMIERVFLDRIKKQLSKSGIKLGLVEPLSSAVLNLIFDKFGEYRTRNILFIHIGMKKTLIFSVSRSNPQFYRIINEGYGSDNDGRITKLLSIDFHSADGIDELSEFIVDGENDFAHLLKSISETIIGIGIHAGKRDLFDGF